MLARSSSVPYSNQGLLYGNFLLPTVWTAHLCTLHPIDQIQPGPNKLFLFAFEICCIFPFNKTTTTMWYWRDYRLSLRHFVRTFGITRIIVVFKVTKFSQSFHWICCMLHILPQSNVTNFVIFQFRKISKGVPPGLRTLLPDNQIKPTRLSSKYTLFEEYGLRTRLQDLFSIHKTQYNQLEKHMQRRSCRTKPDPQRN